MNKKCDELFKNIVSDINKSDLPAGVVYFILKDILREAEKAYFSSLEEDELEVTSL